MKRGRWVCVVVSCVCPKECDDDWNAQPHTLEGALVTARDTRNDTCYALVLKSPIHGSSGLVVCSLCICTTTRCGR